MFSRDTPALFHPLKWCEGAFRWLLWPVLAWRVVAPVPRERSLNLVQRAALGLLRAGIPTVEDIAARLRLHRELVAYVLLELEQLALVDARQRPTARGLEALREDLEEPSDPVVGHVFTDPYQGDVWPRFVERLPFVATVPDDRGFPTIVRGTQGSPERLRPFTLVPSEEACVVRAPEARDVLRAVRAHRAAVRGLDPDDLPLDLPGELDRVTMISGQPEPYLVAVRVRRGDGGEWTADDPFGLGECPRLRRRIELRLDRDEYLRRTLTPLVGPAEGAPGTPSELHVLADWDVNGTLSSTIQQWPVLRERLVAVQRARLEANQEGSPADKRDDVIVKAQKAAERLCRTVLERWPVRDEVAVLSKTDQRFNRELLQALVAEVGFETPAPRGLVSVRAGKIVHALESGVGSLRALLLLCLLGARARGDHPIRRAAAFDRSLLRRLHELAAARDGVAAHDSDRASRVTPDAAAEVVFDAVRGFLDPARAAGS